MICDQLGNHIRYLLEYAEEDYKEVRYEWTTSGPNEWFDVKFKSGLDFPNLPWMEDEDIKISQVTTYCRTSENGIAYLSINLNQCTF